MQKPSVSVNGKCRWYDRHQALLKGEHWLINDYAIGLGMTLQSNGTRQSIRDLGEHLVRRITIEGGSAFSKSR